VQEEAQKTSIGTISYFAIHPPYKMLVKPKVLQFWPTVFQRTFKIMPAPNEKPKENQKMLSVVGLLFLVKVSPNLFI